MSRAPTLAACVAAALALCVFVAPTPTGAWWCDAHMLTVQVALDNVPASTADRLQELIETFNPWFPASDTVVGAACWADDIKSQDVGYFTIMHYVNMIYNPDNLKDLPKPGETQIITALEMSIETLNSTYSNDWDKSLALHFLLHFAGDIHQPLHVTDMYSETYPDGDEGGNFVEVMYQGQNTSLHAFWDSGAGQYGEDILRPLTADGEAELAAWSAQLQAEFPFHNELTENGDINEWAFGSYVVCIDHCYKGVVEGEELSEAYVAEAQHIVNARIALGGYRLAWLLNNMGDGGQYPSGKFVPPEWVRDKSLRYKQC